MDHNQCCEVCVSQVNSHQQLDDIHKQQIGLPAPKECAGLPIGTIWRSKFHVERALLPVNGTLPRVELALK